ncbi:uncharacterized protein LOC120173961 [Hibiscus syriacus]|uniref:uncharacterized protein LOC120173961 n=1 Tax=Hibiscus syriacus TaxID=106335 RepID=UPI001922D14B|nr:uncharacterized protein LOC120173961 [Hibiscus syriacus]
MIYEEEYGTQLAFIISYLVSNSIIGIGGKIRLPSLGGVCFPSPQMLNYAEDSLRCRNSRIRSEILNAEKRDFVPKDLNVLFVYDYMPNGSLDKHIFSDSVQLGWEKLHGFALGIAQGIEFLHTTSATCVNRLKYEAISEY